jgi:hypothetical protein
MSDSDMPDEYERVTLDDVKLPFVAGTGVVRSWCIFTQKPIHLKVSGENFLTLSQSPTEQVFWKQLEVIESFEIGHKHATTGRNSLQAMAWISEAVVEALRGRTDHKAGDIIWTVKKQHVMYLQGRDLFECEGVLYRKIDDFLDDLGDLSCMIARISLRPFAWNGDSDFRLRLQITEDNHQTDMTKFYFNICRLMLPVAKQLKVRIQHVTPSGKEPDERPLFFARDECREILPLLSHHFGRKSVINLQFEFYCEELESCLPTMLERRSIYETMDRLYPAMLWPARDVHIQFLWKFMNWDALSEFTYDAFDERTTWSAMSTEDLKQTQRWQNHRFNHEQKLVALCMGLHERLGEVSPLMMLSGLPDELLFFYLTGYEDWFFGYFQFTH